jgi:hypothetical protein
MIDFSSSRSSGLSIERRVSISGTETWVSDPWVTKSFSGMTPAALLIRGVVGFS